MVNNNDNDRKDATQWWSKVSLKEWAVIIGGIGFFYLNIVGGMESVKTSLNEIKLEIKEYKGLMHELIINQTKISEKVNSIDDRVKKLENDKINNNK